MPVIRRKQSGGGSGESPAPSKKPNVRRIADRTRFSDSVRKSEHVTGTVEHYIANLPTEPIKHTELLLKYVIPYMKPFTMYGININVFLSHRAVGDELHVIDGILVQIKTNDNKNPKIKINGNRNLWIAKIKKFLVINASSDDIKNASKKS